MSGRKWKRLHGGESGWRSQLQCAKKGGSVIERGTLWVSVADRGTVRSSLWWTSALQCRTRTCLVHLFCWFPFVSSNLWFCSLELDGHLNICWTEIQPWMKMKRNPRCEQLQLLNRFFFLISPINILRLRNCIMLKNLKYIFTQHIRNSNLKRPVHTVPLSSLSILDIMTDNKKVSAVNPTFRNPSLCSSIPLSSSLAHTQLQLVH